MVFNNQLSYAHMPLRIVTDWFIGDIYNIL